MKKSLDLSSSLGLPLAALLVEAAVSGCDLGPISYPGNCFDYGAAVRAVLEQNRGDDPITTLDDAEGFCSFDSCYEGENTAVVENTGIVCNSSDNTSRKFFSCQSIRAGQTEVLEESLDFDQCVAGFSTCEMAQSLKQRVIFAETDIEAMENETVVMCKLAQSSCTPLELSSTGYTCTALPDYGSKTDVYCNEILSEGSSIAFAGIIGSKYSCAPIFTTEQ